MMLVKSVKVLTQAHIKKKYDAHKSVLVKTLQ